MKIIHIRFRKPICRSIHFYYGGIFILSACIFILLSCGQTQKDTLPNENVKQHQAAETKMMDPKIAYMQESNHDYGRYHLMWSNDIRRHIQLIEAHGDTFLIEEYVPGILTFSDLFHSIEKVTYFDIHAKILKREINFDSISPYSKQKYKTIKQGGFQRGLEIPVLMSECEPVESMTATEYYTLKLIEPPQDNGYINAHYHLLKAARNNNVVSWEETLIIINPEGEIVFNKVFSHIVTAARVDSNGKYLACSLGNDYGEFDPFSSCADGGAVYNVESGEKIYFEIVKSPQELLSFKFYQNQVHFEYTGNLKNTVRHDVIIPGEGSLTSYLFDFSLESRSLKYNFPKYFEYLKSHAFEIKKNRLK